MQFIVIFTFCKQPQKFKTIVKSASFAYDTNLFVLAIT